MIIKYIYSLIFIAALAGLLWMQSPQQKPSSSQSQPSIPATLAETPSTTTDSSISGHHAENHINTPITNTKRSSQCGDGCLAKYVSKMESGETIAPEEMQQILTNRDGLVQFLTSSPKALETITHTAVVTEDVALKNSIEFILKILPPEELTILASNLIYTADVSSRRSAVKLLAEAYRDEPGFSYTEDEIETDSIVQDDAWQKSKTAEVIKTLISRETDPETKIVAIDIFAQKDPGQVNEEMFATLSDLTGQKSQPKIRGLALKTLSAIAVPTPELATDITNALSTDLPILQAYSLSAMETTLLRIGVNTSQNKDINKLYKESLEEILSDTQTSPIIADKARILLESNFK